MTAQQKKLLRYIGLALFAFGLLAGILWGAWYLIAGGSIGLVPKLLDVAEEGRQEQVSIEQDYLIQKQMLEKEEQALATKENQKLLAEIKEAETLYEDEDDDAMRKKILEGLRGNDES